MKIKRFQAADVRQAIKEVRDVLGPDAVILSNTRVDGGIEIVAATDYDETKFQRPAPAVTDDLDQDAKVEINPSFKQAAMPPITRPEPSQNVWSQEPTLVQMRKEIAGMKDMLQSQLSDLAWKDMERINPVQVQLLHRHLSMGIQVELAKTIVAQSRNTEDLETAWRQ